jgi:2-dehydropantoate 2-reductase
MMRIVILGAGMQGTLYGARLGRLGHDVTFIARGRRAEELRRDGAIIENVLTGARAVCPVTVENTLHPDTKADLCLVTVRREQLAVAWEDVSAAAGLARVLIMVNHAGPVSSAFDARDRNWSVLGFPGAAGSIEGGVDQYVEIPQQPTVIEYSAPEIAVALREAGFKVTLVDDMPSWLSRHAVFITAIGGALCESDMDAARLGVNSELVSTFIRAVREGWAAMDRRGISSAPWALRAIFQWVPSPFAVAYWSRLLRSQRGEYYFARHIRRAVRELAALAADVRGLVPMDRLPTLSRLYAAIDTAAR